MPDPKGKIDSALANMVASGALSAMDAMLALEADDETTVACSEMDDDETSYCSSDEEDESESCFDSDEEERLCKILGARGPRPLGDILEECD